MSPVTDALLRDIRLLRVAVGHPEDTDCEVLVRQLIRIGCRLEIVWPLGEAVPLWADVLFFKADQAMDAGFRNSLTGLSAQDMPALIALVDFEDPTTMRAMLELRPNAVIGKPIQPLGVLANLVVARQARLRLREMTAHAEKLERKLSSVKTVNLAKSILMRQLGLAEPEAHDLLRKQAMESRISIEDMAESVVRSSNIFARASKP